MESGSAPDYQIESCPLCQAPIIWALDDRLERVPVDAESSPAGTHTLRPVWGALPRAVKPSAKLAFGAKLREIHDRTCEKGATLRKKRR